MALLEVKNLVTEFNTEQGKVHAVRDVSFTLNEKEVLGIVGESGSGKSVTMYSVMRLLQDNGFVQEGEIFFKGRKISSSHLNKKQTTELYQLESKVKNGYILNDEDNEILLETSNKIIALVDQLMVYYNEEVDYYKSLDTTDIKVKYFLNESELNFISYINNIVKKDNNFFLTLSKDELKMLINLRKKEAKKLESVMYKIRGNEISMIFQDPMTFLNPVLRISTQLIEPIKLHTNLSKEEAYELAINIMEKVGIPGARDRIKQYPHQFSGGMRQRIIIAMALVCNPKLIIADEPTTALDVTIQAQVLELIKNLTKERETSTIMITHDLGVVASMCERILIMYGGKIVEEGLTNEIFYDHRHPYTKGLLKSIIINNSGEKKELNPIPGSPPDLLKPPAGCPFVDRCDDALKVCKLYNPNTTTLSETHKCACWLLQKEVFNG